MDNKIGKQVWYRNNKAAEKYPPEDIIKILEETLSYVQNDESIELKTEVAYYLLTIHGVRKTTLDSWIKKTHKDNISIVSLYEGIESLIENRLIRNQTIRPNIQALVLQNKHNYAEKKEQKISGGSPIVINRPGEVPKE